MNITIIGNGGWGTALALLLNRNNHNVTVWGPYLEETNKIKSELENTLYLPGISLPESIIWTSNIESIGNANIAIFVIPSRYYQSTIESFKPYLSEKTHLISATKGLEENTFETMSEVAERILNMPIAALSGPSHAEEVALSIPCAVSIASKEKNELEFFQNIFMNESFRVYTSTDVKGVELGGALKNVIAIAAGISDGLGFGDNTKAALMTRGLAEMTRLGIALGANADTFSGLSGIGDLMVTCMSRHSRNRNVGEKLGLGESLESIMKKMKMVAEGIDNCRAAVGLAAESGISLPIIEQVNNIVHHGKDAKGAMIELMNRAPKSESE